MPSPASSVAMTSEPLRTRNILVITDVLTAPGVGLNGTALGQETTGFSKQLIITRYLGHVTG